MKNTSYIHIMFFYANIPCKSCMRILFYNYSKYCILLLYKCIFIAVIKNKFYQILVNR